MTYGLRIAIALDQLANALLGGWPDETLSARVYREGRVRAETAIDTLFFWQPHHCKSAFRSELKRTQLAREYRS